MMSEDCDLETILGSIEGYGFKTTITKELSFAAFRGNIIIPCNRISVWRVRGGG